MYSLVIIDMQPDFDASYSDDIRGPVLREIAQAIKNDRPILIVEYDYPYYRNIGKKRTRTLWYIQNALRGYHNRHLVLKENDDGSREVVVKLKELGAGKNVRVFGVNTDCCVAETAENLVYRGCNVTIVADACNSDCSHFGGLRLLERYAKVIRR